MAVDTIEPRERRAAEVQRWFRQVRAYRDAVRRYQEGVARYYAHGGRPVGSPASADRPAAGPLQDAGPAARSPAEACDWGPLTRREREVAALVTRGLSNRRIAAALVVEEGTVANHVRRIRLRLGFESRSHIAAWVASDERRRAFVPSGAPPDRLA
jgi:DNA-binding NarL/FixJ family response regulator